MIGPDGLQFFLYCAGFGTVTLSLAGAFRILVRPLVPLDDHEQRLSEREERQPEDPSEGLHKRLSELSSTRFGAPIVQRKLDPEKVPLQRPRGQKGRSYSSPVQRPTNSSPLPVPKPDLPARNNVVRFPVKRQKQEDTPKPEKPETGEDKED